MFLIKSLQQSSLADIRDKIADKTKPIGALGQLEKVAEQLALIQSNEPQQSGQKIVINKPTAFVFAGDHGIAAQNVSIAPSDVTRQMVLNFLQGGAAINCFCQSNNIDFYVVDAGIKVALSDEEKTNAAYLIEKRLGAGTADITLAAAMTEAQVKQGLWFGKEVALSAVEQGSNLLMFGEMGIANTSAASAIFMALSGLSAEQCVGQGTGITEQQLMAKRILLTKAVKRASQAVEEFTPENILAQLGGFEIVQITGAILAAAEAGISILIDGFIVTSAALIAVEMHPEVREYLIFAHQSNENSHQLMLEQLNAKPLLNLDLRLGEGTGAALAFPLLRCAVSFYNDMASFDSAGVMV